MIRIFHPLLPVAFSIALLWACNSHSNTEQQNNKDSVNSSANTGTVPDTAMNQTTGAAPVNSAPQTGGENNSSNPNMNSNTGSGASATPPLNPAANGGTREPNTYKSAPGGQYMKANGADRSGNRTTGDNSTSAGSSTSQSHGATTGK